MTHRSHWFAKTLLIGAATLVVAAAGAPTSHAGDGGPAQARLEPLGSRVAYTDRAFTVRVDLTDLEHHGQIQYDDDNDTVPDRFEPSEGMAAYEVRLHFNPAVIDVVDVEPGSFLEESGRNVQCLTQSSDPGEYAFACVSVGSNPGVQGAGLLGTITLMPVSDGTTLLGIEVGLSGPFGDPISVEAEGGAVEVFGTPKDVPTPTPFVSNQPDGPNQSGGSDQPGGSNQPGGSAPPGDGGPTVIGDGTLGDVELPTGNGPALSDTNGDTVINSDDENFPTAGFGYEPIGWSGALAGALAALGAALLLLGLRFAAAARRA